MSFTSTVPVLAPDGGYLFSGFGFQTLGLEAFFRADDGVNGSELWASTGGTSRLVADINPNAGMGSAINSLTCFGTCCLLGADDGSHGREPWVAGSAGATLVTDLNPGTAASNPSNFTAVGITNLYAAATTANEGSELWKVQVDGGLQLVSDLCPGSCGSGPNHLITVGTTLYFTANDGTLGSELYRLDLGSSTPVLVKDINPNPNAGSSAQLFVTF